MSDEPNRKDVKLLSWLGFEKRFHLERARWLGPVMGALLLLFCLAGILFSFVVFAHFGMAVFLVGPYAEETVGEAIRNLGLTLAAILGLPFLLWRTVLASDQNRIAEDSLFNEKINEAARGLHARRQFTQTVFSKRGKSLVSAWEDDVVASVAAIDRLEGLAVERPEFAPRVVRLLAAYVRGNFPASSTEPTPDIETRRIPRTDLQKAIDTIGRILKTAVSVDPSHWRLDLSRCNLDGVTFAGGYFRAVDFSNSRIEGGIFEDANLEGCQLRHCLLNYSLFRGADLTGARLDYAILNETSGWQGGLDLADSLKGVSLIAADISAVRSLGTLKKRRGTMGNLDTKISQNLRSQMLSHDEQDLATLCRRVRDDKKLTEEEEVLVRKLESTGFQYWSPYSTEDMATGDFLRNMREELQLDFWPYA